MVSAGLPPSVQAWFALSSRSYTSLCSDKHLVSYYIATEGNPRTLNMLLKICMHGPMAQQMS